MTETELVLMSMTNEELHDFALFVGHMHDRWRESRRVAEAERVDRLTDLGYRGTDGPIHGLRAMDLAIVRERAQRGGAQGWEAGMDLDGHPGASRLRYYQERITLNPDQGEKPRLSEAGTLERVCPACGEAKPLTVVYWMWLETSLATNCRACMTPDPAGTYAAFVAIQDTYRQEAPPVPVEPVAPDPVEDDVAAYL